jgi:16S rRNA (uracil1498-N3)-methyltransferase
MSSHRFLFYSAGATASSKFVTLDGAEHHHISRALRTRPNDTLFVTNGRGLILECRVTSVSRFKTDADVVSVDLTGEDQRPLVLALGLIKKDKFERAFEQCVELGITRCVPFVSDRARYETYSSKFLDRLHQIAVAAIKQSFRPVLPHVCEPIGFDELLVTAKKMPRAVVGRQGASPFDPDAGADTMVIVGPEAGLTDEEHDALTDAGAEFAAVSPNRLRSETAAVALVAAVWSGD